MNDSQKKSALLGQMASLADFMHVAGRDAYDVLPEHTKAELHVLFDAINDELQDLIAKSNRDYPRSHVAKDSSMERV